MSKTENTESAARRKVYFMKFECEVKQLVLKMLQNCLLNDVHYSHYMNRFMVAHLN